MEESQIASLPPELAAEAQFLRRDWESRNGARMDAHPPTNALCKYPQEDIDPIGLVYSIQILNRDKYKSKSWWLTNLNLNFSPCSSLPVHATEYG